MIKTGMFISDRYEIIDKVGSGGMADVYKAKCHRLNRYVAIKILKSEFSSDQNFVQKFRAEAQSVAGLSHPNIVSVYDVGDDDGLHYIVMELVEGITLKKFIERKGKLDVKETVGIAIQIAQAMEAAHAHHIVHRDIKPQNIIISREGKVKVADFGIAKAATSNTISQNALGSVHYLSPEQARGGYSDERSDIYSLGITLYEMLTGQVPFAGDNSVSVALLHIQSEATPVQQLNPEVPTSVDRIVQKCMQKKPERRYQNASELIRDLKRSIINPDGDYVNIASNAIVSNSPTRIRTEEELHAVKSAAKSPVVHFDNSTGSVSSPDQRQSRHVKKEAEELDSMDSTLEKVLTVVSVIFAVALICVIFYLLWQFFFNGKNSGNPDDPTVTSTMAPTNTASKITPTSTPTPSPTPAPVDPEAETFRMPQVCGLTVEDATSLLKKYSEDLNITWTEEDFSDEYPQGTVCAQYPPVDIQVDKKTGTVKLTISAGKELVQLTDVTNREYGSAKALLEAYDFTVVPLYEYSDTIEEGKVIRTEPEALSMVAKETEVIVYISQGSETKTIAVPNIVGYTKAQAQDILTNAGLVPGKASKVYSDDYASGIVCAQDIPANTLVEEGTTVKFSVSKGSKSSGGDDSGDEGDSGDSGDTGDSGEGGGPVG
ncbi:MAG: Stk1 family PASTA domain-containing Ser/Thr kinase [Lachnospiraceae bacterium]|nr:Stk1 family PASTA domain-containing Ser/Thr kinase [Lachnospiraceae bacterium]